MINDDLHAGIIDWQDIEPHRTQSFSELDIERQNAEVRICPFCHQPVTDHDDDLSCPGDYD